MHHIEIEDFPTVGFASPTSRRRGDRLLTVGAVLGSVCLIATIIALAFGVRPMIFETGSMAPTIPTGSLGLGHSMPATSVQRGDVVSVIRDDGVRVTHRVASVDGRTGNSVSLTLRGDANDADDPRTYAVTQVDRVLGTVPFLGYVAAWLKNPYTLALQALAILFLLAVGFAPRQGWRNSSAGQRVLTGTAAATVVVVGITSVHGTGEALAASDTATATGTVNAGRPAGPTSFSCTNSSVLILFSSVQLSWPASPNYTAYKLSLPDDDDAHLATVPATQSTGTETYVIAEDLLSALLDLLNIFGSSSVRIRLTNLVGNFESAGYRDQWIRKTTLLELPTGIKCGTAPAGAALRAAPESSDPGQAATQTDGAEHADESTSATTTPDSTAPPAGGILSEPSDYAYFRSGSEVTIRSAETGEAVYEGRYPSTSEIRWLPGTSTLQVTDPDGTVTTVERDGSRWTETVVEPAATEATAPDDDSDAPSHSPSTPAATSMPAGDEPAEP
ncbi:peptidase S26 [Gordonia rubripertincta]|uniref:peptidase S26 n=1 Tax=Gordonia rubripertincta TaxID=36822 RepID=UPI000B8D6A58|nr:peptidase S26 [Gordonia rubripertincta]ASR04178.1 hypothetical protein GCWB2_16990 [Gordonia rubripertincta]